MLTRDDIITILEECKKLAKKRLTKDQAEQFQSLQVDIVSSSKNFLGRYNSAIFVNKTTFKYLGKEHENWIPDKTIAIDENIFKQNPLKVIGTIIHEIGHAFSVATKIANTEGNAYIFEIKLMRHLFKTHHPLLAPYSKEDLQQYFEMRLSDYEHAKHTLLNKFITEIRQKTILENKNDTISNGKMSHTLHFRSASIHSFSNTKSCIKAVAQQERLVNLASRSPVLKRGQV